MAERPWLTIIGFGEDGTNGLSPASLAALEAAEIVMAPPRHLSLLPKGPWTTVAWPVPFADGIPMLLQHRGTQVAVLASGDPFWFGAGSVLVQHLKAEEWQAFPGPSAFSLVASRLGWPLERVTCLGLHAAPLSRLRPHLADKARIIVLLRDGKALADLADYLTKLDFEDSTITVCEALGGPREAITNLSLPDVSSGDFRHPVCAALEIAGEGRALPLTSGRPDDVFAHDGQITKRHVRAMTLSALSPVRGEHLWDIGGGSGSIGIEWLLAHPSLQATCIESDPGRAKQISENAKSLGVDRLQVIEGAAPEALKGLARPQAVFVGGGLSSDLLQSLKERAAGARLVANAVTLETETLLCSAQQEMGGTLTRIELSHATPLGRKRGWRASFPIVQWSVQL